MTEKEVLTVIAELNEKTENFYKHELPKFLSVKDGLIAIADWFKAQIIINESGIKENRLKTLEMLREMGFDVKINMQDYTLSYHGKVNDNV